MVGNANCYSLLFSKSDLAIVKNHHLPNKFKSVQTPTHTDLNSIPTNSTNKVQRIKRVGTKIEVRMGKNSFEEQMRKINEL